MFYIRGSYNGRYAIVDCDDLSVEWFTVEELNQIGFAYIPHYNNAHSVSDNEFSLIKQASKAKVLYRSLLNDINSSKLFFKDISFPEFDCYLSCIFKDSVAIDGIVKVYDYSATYEYFLLVVKVRTSRGKETFVLLKVYINGTLGYWARDDVYTLPTKYPCGGGSMYKNLFSMDLECRQLLQDTIVYTYFYSDAGVIIVDCARMEVVKITGIWRLEK